MGCSPLVQPSTKGFVSVLVYKHSFFFNNFNPNMQTCGWNPSPSSCSDPQARNAWAWAWQTLATSRVPTHPRAVVRVRSNLPISNQFHQTQNFHLKSAASLWRANASNTYFQYILPWRFVALQRHAVCCVCPRAWRGTQAVARVEATKCFFLESSNAGWIQKIVSIFLEPLKLF